MKRETNTSFGIGRLVTPVLPVNKTSCLRWHMALTRQANFFVYLIPSSGQNVSLLYTINGDRQQQWKLAQATIHTTTLFGLLFEGLLIDNTTDMDSISIDNLGIHEGPCSDVGSCDFEHDICGYENMPGDFDWKRTSFNTQSSNAPMLDHTTSTRSGSYLWVDRQQTIAGRRARIESEFVSNEIRCLSFWYYMQNTINSQLNIYLHDRFDDRYILIESINQSHGAFWKLKQITINSSLIGNVTKYFSVMFEAVTGSTISGQ